MATATKKGPGKTALIKKGTELAEILERKAARLLRDDTKLWTGDSEEAEMLDLVRKDNKNYVNISAYMRAGEFSKASRMAMDLDTSARDMIPTTVWRYLERF